jgi:hypothetical protein
VLGRSSSSRSTRSRTAARFAVLGVSPSRTRLNPSAQSNGCTPSGGWARAALKRLGLPAYKQPDDSGDWVGVPVVVGLSEGPTLLQSSTGGSASQPEAQAAMDEEAFALQAESAVEEARQHSSPGFCGRLFVVPKQTGGWRPVLDLSTLNIFMRKIRFEWRPHSRYG